MTSIELNCSELELIKGLLHSGKAETAGRAAAVYLLGADPELCSLGNRALIAGCIYTAGLLHDCTKQEQESFFAGVLAVLSRAADGA